MKEEKKKKLFSTVTTLNTVTTITTVTTLTIVNTVTTVTTVTTLTIVNTVTTVTTVTSNILKYQMLLVYYSKGNFSQRLTKTKRQIDFYSCSLRAAKNIVQGGPI